MKTPADACAREILETVPLVMGFIRGQIRRHRTAGLALPQFRALAFAGRVPEPSLSAAAGHLGLSLPAMSRLVQGLVRRGLLERRAVRTNRRQIALALTARGQATLEQVRAAIRRQLAESLSPLSAPDRTAIQRAMRALRGAFDSRREAGAPAEKGSP